MSRKRHTAEEIVTKLRQVDCQSASKIDPGSASKIDPLFGVKVVRPEAMREAPGVAQRIAGGRSGGGDQARFLRRQLSLPVSTMSQ
jgi:hypothetical protein